jgi:hypothetical protein
VFYGSHNGHVYCFGTPVEECPASLAVSGDSETVEEMRSFRDQVLEDSLEGRELITLFYKHEHEVATILNENPDVLQLAKDIMVVVLAATATEPFDIQAFIDTATTSAQQLLLMIRMRASESLIIDIEHYLAGVVSCGSLF